jgi:tRNA dimethylallyltransferase
VGGLAHLIDELAEQDPEAHQQLDLNNPRRVMRAIEVIRHTGGKFSAFQNAPRVKRPFRLIKVGIDCPRPQLHERINRRCEQMLATGLLEEVDALLAQGYGLHNKALHTIGYRELLNYRAGGYASLEAALARMQTATRQYARRQLTWFRRDPAVVWFGPDQLPAIEAYLQEALKA